MPWHDAAMHDDQIRLRQPAPDELRAWVGATEAAFADDFTDAALAAEVRLWEADRLIGAWTATRGSGPAARIRTG